MSDAFDGQAERCCAALCDYRPEAVGYYLRVIRDLKEAGQDVAEAAKSALASQDGGRAPGFSPGSGSTRYADVLIDVQRAASEIRAAGGRVSAAAVARRLCPWSLNGDGPEASPLTR